MKTKVCIFTNYPYSRYKKKCLEVSADYFLIKTGDFKDIYMVISKMSIRN